MKYTKLYDYIPYFESIRDTDEGVTYVSRESEEEQMAHMPCCRFSEEIDAFIRLCYEYQIVQPDYMKTIDAFYGRGDRMKPTRKEIDEAPIEVAEAFISKLIRQNQFVDGMLARSLKDGTMLLLVKRLQTLDC